MTLRENIQTLILSKLLGYNRYQCNILNKECSLNLDVAYCVYFDIPNIINSHTDAQYLSQYNNYLCNWLSTLGMHYYFYLKNTGHYLESCK